MLLKIIILLLLHECNAQLNVFEIDYFGNEISVEEFKKLDVCYSRICMRDAKKIIAKASHRNDSDPCLDFSEYACGHFNAYKPPSERYYYVGFNNDILAQLNYFIKKVLKEKIEEDEPKIFKIVKKYYQKCVNSTYVRNEGKAEFKSLLYEFGKFPIFEDNWKPSDFNVTKALIFEAECLHSFYEEDNQIYINVPDEKYIKNETIRNVLRLEYYLSEEKSSEILNDYFELYNVVLENSRYQIYKKSVPVPIHNLDKLMNITSGLDWLEIIKQQINNNDISNDTLVILEGELIYFTIFDLKNRRKLANYFTIRFLHPKLEYFSVYPVPYTKIRSKNRYEICIEHMETFVKFPLEIMFQLKYGNKTTSKAFKDFIEKFLTIQSSLARKKNEDEIDDKTIRLVISSIIVDLPEELTLPEFLNNLYANLTSTGDEGLYKMSQQLKDYYILIFQEENNSIAVENLSENGKEIFKNFGGPDKPSIFNIYFTLYPFFHPQRPYYVNLAYLSNLIYYLLRKHNIVQLLNLTNINVQKHYLKYVEKFGPEQNLPGFLMTNEQMLQMIIYQTNCYKTHLGEIGSYNDVSKSTFNCPIDEKTGQKEDESIYYNIFLLL